MALGWETESASLGDAVVAVVQEASMCHCHVPEAHAAAWAEIALEATSETESLGG